MLSALALASCVEKSFDCVSYVDPKIGTGGHGHVFVGANVPFGMVQAGPTSIPQSWDWCSGYHDSDSTVIGFSQTHLSGTGVGDLFDVTLMPVVGEVTYSRGTEDDPLSGLWSYASRSEEIARPGYYSVPLLRYGIKAEMTATSRVAFHRYTFPRSDEAAIVVDLENGGCWDNVTEAHIEKTGDRSVSGWRFSKGWADDQKVYFTAEFSKDFEFEAVNEFYTRLSFSTSEGESVLVKVALSPTSVDGAKSNLEAELPGWDFERTAEAAGKAWNEELGKIKVETSDSVSKKVFYTALYHTMVAPSEFFDAGSQTKAYTTYSLWDTYRAAMPLMTLVHPQMMPGIINDMLNICDKQGRLPVWHLWGCETDCMVGNPGAVVVADAIVKGIEGFDKERAFDALVKTMLHDGRGGGIRKEHGFIPGDLMNQACANDMEYAIADGAVAAAAKALGKVEEEKFFTERSHSYRNYFDPSIGFIRGKLSDGSWREDYNPFFSSHTTDDFCEGNGWQYTWLVPQDLDGLLECFGSKDRLIGKLDSLFNVSSMLDGDEVSADISGLIGQYAHGNEPSHHVLYFYTMLGQPWKTAEKVREVLSTLYHAEPDGLSGNEDVGQMSAWYVLSALGFYEVEPAGGRYWFGTPLFDEVEMRVQGGKLRIIAENNSSSNKYIQKVWLNGKEHDEPFIWHKDLQEGGELRFLMGPEPALWYGE